MLASPLLARMLKRDSKKSLGTLKGLLERVRVRGVATRRSGRARSVEVSGR